MSQYILQAAEGYQAEAGVQLLDGQEVEGGGGDVAPQAVVPGEFVAPKAAVLGEHVAPQAIPPGGACRAPGGRPRLRLPPGRARQDEGGSRHAPRAGRGHQGGDEEGQDCHLYCDYQVGCWEKDGAFFSLFYVLYPVWQVKKLLEASHMLVDVDDLWVKLGKEAVEAGSKVATHDNLDRINTSVLLFSVLFDI